MLHRSAVETVIRAGLAEDAPWGDLTSELALPEDAHATATVVSRESGAFAGAEVIRVGFTVLDPAAEVELHVADGDQLDPGTAVATVRGPARAVLTAERTVLNLVQRMSGIATTTARYVAAVEETVAEVERSNKLPAGTITRTRVCDTRKTTPGLRALEKHAVTCGGGHNHRFGLSDAVMLKDNHLAVLTAGGAPLSRALRDLRRKMPHTTCMVVEVDRLDQIEDVLAGGADVVLLDNFAPADLVSGVAMIDGRAAVEASGGITLETIGRVAATGVDVISVGALTHSARALDLGLDIVVG
ncbi:carboxylating nicotinate-nucleotide diphosphorylase [Kocuria rhizophila]|uniref:carboxylating nicotinate-nucleotide diphosphorylase n=1 Tax=Kocuria rhizophila TaxID=72000 RepID=UPI0011A1A47A|nr:carboxylating nicotinate-nucleotide diphosphorylase [Kocuria rhizophila]WTI31763.1 carboxylating nicotinate-nucleotide diphosphorylase [Kocuria rhizophila]